MIDENKEQLRNLFRNYNVLDVQPAVTARAPDDLTTLQVCVCEFNVFAVSRIHYIQNEHLFYLFQMAIIILAVLLFLAAMLFILMNWYYRTV